MSPFYQNYFTEDTVNGFRYDDYQVKKSHVHQSTEVGKAKEDRRPIHRLRKRGLKRANQGLVQPRVTSRKDEKVEFRDGFLTCAALLQSYVRTHPRLGNRLKDELLISIHQYNQLILNTIPSTGQGQQHQDNVTNLPIKQEALDDDREAQGRESTSPDVMSESQSVTSEMTTSDSVHEGDDVGSPLFLHRPEVLAEVQVLPDSITCRHCNEKDMQVVGCRYQPWQKVDLPEDQRRCDSPQLEPEDLRTNKETVSQSTTEYTSVSQSTTEYPPVSQSTTEYPSVSQSTTDYPSVSQSTTENPSDEMWRPW